MRTILTGTIWAVLLLGAGGATRPALAAVCGNGVVEAGEACDDGGQGCCANGCQTVAPASTPCDDHNACTCNDTTLCPGAGNAAIDHCDGAGRCLSGRLDTCDDGEVCTRDTCDPLRGCRHGHGPQEEGLPCDDNLCTDDRCHNGRCRTTPRQAGTACSDEYPPNCCTVDTCDAAGTCRHAPKCALDGNCQHHPVCDPQSCACTMQPAQDGELCNDANPCTLADHCESGVCVARPVDVAVDCNDGNPCTKDQCDPAVGCTHPKQASGTACELACVTGRCDNAQHCVGDPKPEGTACAGIPGECRDASGAVCHDGVCRTPPREEGTPCAGVIAPCVDASAAHCVEGLCFTPPLPDGSACPDDGNPCTSGVACQAGYCQPTGCNPEAMCTLCGVACTNDLVTRCGCYIY